jgi:benzoylformate decarboxylase
VTTAAGMLADAARPLIIMGDGIAAADAQDELARVAELTGAEVWGADASEMNIPATHPQYLGALGHMFGEHSRALTRHADVVLICGTYVFPEVFPMLQGVFAQGAKVIHIDLDAYEIGKNFPVDLGMVSDPRLTLGRLADALQRTMTAGQKQAAVQRAAAIGAAKERTLAAEHAADLAARDAVPMRPARFMEELADQLPENALIFDEALTSSPALTRYLPPVTAGHYFQTRGGSLGVGIPGAIGLKLAHPDKEVWGFTGDGGSMYTIQALWTAAHHKVGAKFVICNNRSYALLKYNVQQYWNERDIPEREFPASFDITCPDIDFGTMARSMGVPAARVEVPDQVAPAISAALAHDGPFLIDLVLDGEIPGHHVYPRCGQ